MANRGPGLTCAGQSGCDNPCACILAFFSNLYDMTRVETVPETFEAFGTRVVLCVIQPAYHLGGLLIDNKMKLGTEMEVPRLEEKKERGLIDREIFRQLPWFPPFFGGGEPIDKTVKSEELTNVVAWEKRGGISWERGGSAGNEKREEVLGRWSCLSY